MKDQQDPGDDEFDPASNASSSGPVPDSGQIGYVQRPSSIGPDSPRRLAIAPDSPMASVAKVLSLSTTVQLAELQTIAKAFLAEVVERLSCASTEGGKVPQHAPFRQTLDRSLAADEAAVRAKTGTDGTGVPVRGTTGAEAALETAIRAMPDFPRFRLGQTFDRWVHELAQTEDVAELSALLGATSTHTFGRIIIAVTLVHGLPQFLRRCEGGEFTIEHVHAAARVAKDLPFEDLPELDEYLGRRRADVTIETFKKSLAMKAASMQDEDDRSALASRRRRVSITTYEDGTASVTLTGPAAELKAFHQRLEAFARAIRHGNIASLTAADPGDVDVSALGSIDSLMFDIATRVTPQLTIEVTAHDTENGTSSVKEIPLELPDQGVPTAARIVSLVNDAAAAAQAEAEDAASSGTATATAAPAGETAGDRVDQPAGSGRTEVSTVVKLVMPTHGQWIREQAKMLVTVPFLTLTDQSQLPGIFSDGAPIPASVARSIAGQCSTWTRIMTDPVTGTPLDARAQSYRIPMDVRLPLTAKWRGCTMPGCTRDAETSEVDHIIPFDHDSPAAGGQTSFENTHPLCRPHHQAKTDRKFSIRKTSDGPVEYVFSHGVTTEAAPPDDPINARHAELFADLGPPPVRQLRQRAPNRKGRHGRKRGTGRPDRRPEQTIDPWSSSRIGTIRWDSGDPPPF
ncbi:HNH endonuclease signature motif containing protein [Brevibacterium renqingii]|uniref:HNH endonuclease signature motif containing protein n=1 Tax=Brevibacterium renqingii TaxID=2776916 RepID=UPI001AE0C5D2|nr:HNH endonuclease signature motif containing protein [Brevibacterium renqingii]